MRLRADGQDISHVEFRIVDAQGVRVPDATNEVAFTLDGPARIIGIENGDLFSLETGNNGIRRGYRGRGLAILQAMHVPGRIRLTARAEGLQESLLELEAIQK